MQKNEEGSEEQDEENENGGGGKESFIFHAVRIIKVGLKKRYHVVHLLTHISYLGLVSIGSSHYSIAAGILLVVVIIGEVIRGSQ